MSDRKTFIFSVYTDVYLKTFIFRPKARSKCTIQFQINSKDNASNVSLSKTKVSKVIASKFVHSSFIYFRGQHLPEVLISEIQHG